MVARANGTSEGKRKRVEGVSERPQRDQLYGKRDGLWGKSAGRWEEAGGDAEE
jgi:hypothetical protein